MSAPKFDARAVVPSEIELDSMESAIAAVKAGEFIIVVDDLDRENEGDLIIAASAITTEQMAWIIQHSSSVRRFSFRAEAHIGGNDRGFICICLEKERLRELEIGMMVQDNQDRNGTAYTITVDYAHGPSLAPRTFLRTPTHAYMLQEPRRVSQPTIELSPRGNWPIIRRKRGISTGPVTSFRCVR